MNTVSFGRSVKVIKKTPVIASKSDVNTSQHKHINIGIL